MPMQTVTKPIMLDETGQAIVAALSGLTDAVKPDAINIPYDNSDSGLISETVQEAIDENTDSISELNSSLSSKIGGKYINTGETMSITFSSYNSAVIIFGNRNGTDYIMYLFGNGYLVPIKTLNNVNVSISSNYKTISITNNINSSTLWVGVLNAFNVDMTIN